MSIKGIVREIPGRFSPNLLEGREGSDSNAFSCMITLKLAAPVLLRSLRDETLLSPTVSRQRTAR